MKKFLTAGILVVGAVCIVISCFEENVAHRPCSSDDDCLPGRVCDPVNQYCVDLPDGGNEDSGSDGGKGDTGIDGSFDASSDAGSDGGVADAATDGSVGDVGFKDSGTDAGFDAGVDSGIVGDPCANGNDCLGVPVSPVCVDSTTCSTLLGIAGCQVPDGYCLKYTINTSVGDCGPSASEFQVQIGATDLHACLHDCSNDLDCRAQYKCWKPKTPGGCVWPDFFKLFDGGTDGGEADAGSDGGIGDAGVPDGGCGGPCPQPNPDCVSESCQCGAQTCSGTTADNCVGGECKCGGSAECTYGSINPKCLGGTCKCGSTSICNAGSANKCEESTGQCKCGTGPACSGINPDCLSSVCHCGTSANTCIPTYTDNCTGGSCKCGSSAACVSGYKCLDAGCKFMDGGT